MYDVTANVQVEKIFTYLNLIRAYYQISVEPEHIPKTAIITPFWWFGLLRIPFGLRNASQSFQRFIHNMLHMVYILPVSALMMHS